MSTYCITTYENRLCGCLLEDSRLMEVQLFAKEHSLIGSIYIGKVKNILKNIDAAFVEIANGRICFLPLSEAKQPILTNRRYDGRLIAGDEILVQVKKDAVKTKDPVLTAQLSFSGRFAAAAIDGRKKIQYSHKLPKEKQTQISAALKAVTLPENVSLIVRTETGELTDYAPLIREAEQLLKETERILKIGATRTVFSQLNREEPAFIRYYREMSVKPDRIITDQPTVHAQLHSYFVQAMPDILPQLSLYQDEKLTLYQLYGLSARLQEAFSRQVWLKSGGYLVIEPTEALTVIDVNTGKFSGNKLAQETFLKINLEAAEEIARQLRLRNLSGIIVVDFINMTSHEMQNTLIRAFSAALEQDPVTTRLIDMTPLGLVEITRKKVHMSLAEQLKISTQNKPG